MLDLPWWPGDTAGIDIQAGKYLGWLIAPCVHVSVFRPDNIRA